MIVGASAVSNQGKGFPSQMVLSVEETIKNSRLFCSGIQRVPAILQMFHAGPKTSRQITGSDVVAVSDRQIVKSRYDKARPLDRDGISRVVSDFVAAAVNAVEAGFSGIELHGANGYLLHGFSDPETNDRADQWRDPFLLASTLVSEIRSNVPADFAVGYTLSPFKIHHAGVDGLYPTEYMVQLVRCLRKAGIDFVHVYRNKEKPFLLKDRLSLASLLKLNGLTLPIIEGGGSILILERRLS